MVGMIGIYLPISETIITVWSLLPGLSPAGVPVSLRGTAKPFSFNALHELEYLADNNELAAVKWRFKVNPTRQGFLDGVRNICDKKVSF